MLIQRTSFTLQNRPLEDLFVEERFPKDWHVVPYIVIVMCEGEIRAIEVEGHKGISHWGANNVAVKCHLNFGTS